MSVQRRECMFDRGVRRDGNVRAGMAAALRGALALAAWVMLVSLPAVSEPAGARIAAAQRLAQSSNWTYQLQGAKPRDLGQTRYDVIVMDAFFGGGPRDVSALRRGVNGHQRVVLAYLSIGEAEVYRYYWQRCCGSGRRPAWMGAENKRWRGNYSVQYWDPEWKGILYEDDDSYLKRIVDLGFDGVYLDRIDIYREMPKVAAARREMVALVDALANKARSLKPDFLVVAQNAEELADDPHYLAAIDGIAKEDLFFGVDGDGRRNDKGTIETSVDLLRRAQEAGKHIMVVEYLKDPAVIEMARTEILELGFVPYFAPRGLERVQVENLELDDSH